MQQSSTRAPPSADMIVTDTASDQVSNWNRQTYQRLKLSLSLGLRRQLFVAVCDDLSLRDRLAGKLYAELGATPVTATTDTRGYPKLVSLNLNSIDPNPLGQMAQWLAQNRQSRNYGTILGFQILGVERLTRQPPAIQRLFLRRLQAIERNLPRMESTLLFWLPRPWFHTIVQSVPEFWQWHTGIFEFEGEPTPLPPVGASQPEASSISVGSGETTSSFKQDLQNLLAHDLADIANVGSTGESGEEKQQHDDNSETDRVARTIPADGVDALPSLFAEQKSLDAKATPGSASATPFPLANQDLSALDYASTDEDESDPTLPSLWSIPGESFSGPQIASLPSDATATDAPQESEVIASDEPIDDSLPLGNASSQGDSSTSGESPDSNPQSQADAYLQLGNYYRQVIEHGDTSEENLAIAIQAYEQALQFLEEDSPEAADILNDVGNLYWMLSRYSTNSEQALSYIEQAIRAYQLALAKLTAEDAPHTYAMIQNNLGAAYGDLARHKEPVESLEQSIRAYEEALRYRPAQSDPLKYASTQNNLGTAYWNLAQHQSPVENLRAAIAAYTEALSHYQTQSEPLNWAMIQNNLGTAYWNLAQYEQPETWLDLAIAAYQDALKYRTPEVAPAACAATQNNLGTAYWHLADRFQNQPDTQVNYLQKSIAAYEEALALAGSPPFAKPGELSQNTPPLPVNFDVLATHNNLGLAHYQLATEPQFSLSPESKSAHLDSALERYVQVCTGVDRGSDSYQTALSYIIKIIRSLYQESGISGQNHALSKVPGQLLPEILPRL